jgi:hypothetical protein
LRRKLAYDAELTNAVMRIFIRAVAGYYRKRAKRRGLTDVRCGSVVALHRAGSALNVNLHIHALVLDGVFHRPDPNGPIRFQALARHNDKEFRAALLRPVAGRIIALLRRRGLLPDSHDDSPEHDGQPTLLDRLTELSVAGLNPDGTRPAREPTRRPPRPTRHQDKRSPGKGPSAATSRKRKPLCHTVDGFSLHARTRVAAARRGELEILCKYLLRPAITYDQVELCPDGRVAWHLRRCWADGTRVLYFEPHAFLARLATLVPPPRRNQLRYYGVLAPNAKWRREVVASAPKAAGVRRSRRAAARCRAARSTTTRSRYLSWSQLLRRTFGVDVLRCQRCGGRRVLLAFIQDPHVARRILVHLGLAGAARPPPKPTSPP